MLNNFLIFKLLLTLCFKFPFLVQTLLGREKSEPAYVQKMEAIRNALRHRLEVVTREYDLTLKQEL